MGSELLCSKALGEISGSTSPEDLPDRIFSAFCFGKERVELVNPTVSVLSCSRLHGHGILHP